MTSETSRPFGYAVRARVNGAVIGEWDDAIRVDDDELPSVLWFRRDSLPAEVAAFIAASGAGELAGYVSLDAGRVTLEVVDARPGETERDVTTKVFPTWGDAADLTAMLDVKPDGINRWTGPAKPDWRRGVVEASQMLGQALVAAGRHIPGRRAVHASMVFGKTADVRVPVSVELEEVSSGRTFTTLSARVTQPGRTCGIGTFLLDRTSADLIRHHIEAPAVPGPYASTPYDMSMTGRDLRIVDNAYTGDPDAPVGPPLIDAWLRFRDMPEDSNLHAGMLTQFTGHMSIAAALRAHSGIGQSQAHRTISTAINAITISIHADVRVDRWLLYHHESTFAGDGMTHSQCRVHDLDGALVASFTVEAMVRGFADPQMAADARVAL